VPTAWSPLKATSSSDKVTVNAGSTAVPVTLSFTVKQTATSDQITFSQTYASSDAVAAPNATLTKGGKQFAITTANGTLDEFVTAVNNLNAGVVATKVSVGAGRYRVSLTATDTGASSAFTLTNLLVPTTDALGKDAQIVVGLDTISSASNTFTGLLQGVDVTLAPGTPLNTSIDITVSRDPAAAQQSLQGLVDAANEILTQIDKLTAYDKTTKTAGAFVGDSLLRDLRAKVLDTVTRPAGNGSLADVGVQTDRYGKITFDTTKFASAYNADPAKVATRLTTTTTTTPPSTVPGFAARLEAAAKIASDSTTGVLTQSIKGRQSSVTTMQDSIAAWDNRLATKKDALTRQFAALEVSLSKLQNQSSWLSGQINSLPSSSS
jgi:flagellar hook-associated protein 2